MSDHTTRIALRVCAVSLCIYCACAAPVAAITDDPAVLRNLIAEKENELRLLEQQRDVLETVLSQTGDEKASLQSELKKINYEIQGLKNSVEENTLTIEKLGLEIASIRDEMRQTSTDIENAKTSVAHLLVELQQKNGNTLLTTLLGHATFSEGASAIQSIIVLTGRLSAQAQELYALQNNLKRQQESIARKRNETETEQNTLANRQSLIESTKNEKEVLLAQTHDKEQVYEDKLDELGRQQDEISAMMTEIEKRLRETINTSLLPIPRKGLLAVPMLDSCTTQGYGYTKFAEKAYRTSFHGGIDMRAQIGDPVYAADAGVIAAVDNNDTGTSKWRRYQYGKYVIVQHDNNLSTLYAHLSKQTVKQGQAVKKGDIIGYAGNTGYATGPHLHFGVYVTPIRGWQERANADASDGGLIKTLAAGLVPVGATLNPLDYLYQTPSCYNN